MTCWLYSSFLFFYDCFCWFLYYLFYLIYSIFFNSIAWHLPFHFDKQQAANFYRTLVWIKYKIRCLLRLWNGPFKTVNSSSVMAIFQSVNHLSNFFQILMRIDDLLESVILKNSCNCWEWHQFWDTIVWHFFMNE